MSHLIRSYNYEYRTKSKDGKWSNWHKAPNELEINSFHGETYEFRPCPDPLPCPFCGGKLIEKQYNAYSTDSSFNYIGCDSCDCALMDAEKINADTIKQWNTRK